MVENFQQDFFEAIEQNNLELLKASIENGANPDCSAANGQPILAAIFTREDFAEPREALVNYLIQQGVNTFFTDYHGETLLHRAVNLNMFTTAELLIRHGVDHRKKNQNGETALFKTNKFNMLKMLADNDVDSFDAVNIHGDTLLHRACGIQPNIELITCLINYIDVNVRNNSGDSPLLNILQYDLFPQEIEKAIKLLIENGAELNAKDTKNRTPIIVATRNQKLPVNILEILISNGADITHVDDLGNQAIHYAAVNNVDHLELLLNHQVDVNIVSQKSLETPLCLAVKYNREAAVKILLQHDADVNLTDASGKSPLSYANEKDLKVLQEILTQHQGIAVSHVDNTSTDIALSATEIERAIHAGDFDTFITLYPNASMTSDFDIIKLAAFVIEHGDIDMFVYVVEQGLNIHTEVDGYTWLHNAVFYNQLDIAEYLLALGLDANAVSDDNRTVFMLASNSSAEMVELLKNAGVAIYNKKYANMVEEAIRYQNPAMAKYFLSQGYKFDKKIFKDEGFLLELIRSQDIESLAFLLEGGLSVDKKITFGDDKYSLLHSAVLIGAQHMVSFLLEKQGDSNIRSASGTPLFKSAIESGNLEILYALYGNGCNVNDYIKNTGQTVLIFALQLRRIKFVKVLLDYEVDVDVADKQGNSALHYAAKMGFSDVVEILCGQGASLNKKNKNGQQPIDLARSEGKDTVVELLVKMTQPAKILH